MTTILTTCRLLFSSLSYCPRKCLSLVVFRARRVEYLKTERECFNEYTPSLEKDLVTIKLLVTIKIPNKTSYIILAETIVCALEQRTSGKNLSSDSQRTEP